MSCNRTAQINGSYKDAEGKQQTFSVESDGYTEDAAGLKELTADYGAKGICEVVNKARDTKAINSERTRLTEDVRGAVKTKANDFDRLKSASTPEEQQAIMKELGLIK